MTDSPERHGPASIADVTDEEFQGSLIRAIHESSPDGILVVDGKGVIVSNNRRFVEIWQIPEHDIEGSQPGTAIGANDDRMLASVLDRVKDRQGFLDRVQELYANPEIDDHSEIELTDGRTLERHSTVLRGHENHYLGRVWFFRDVTARKQTEAALRALTRQDPLTGAANRTHFSERANQEFARVKRQHAPVCVSECDIDYFKAINDRYGHAAGDEVLKALTNKARALIRVTDLFARIGGEEFAVLLCGADIDGGKRASERLRSTVAGIRVKVDGNEIAFTISIGVSERQTDDASAEDCLRRADRALYRAKENGRNRVEVEP